MLTFQWILGQSFVVVGQCLCFSKVFFDYEFDVLEEEGLES